MKSTGILRRVDDFGRIGIPKSIRQQFEIKENDTMEFFIDNEGNITIKKVTNTNVGLD